MAIMSSYQDFCNRLSWDQTAEDILDKHLKEEQAKAEQSAHGTSHGKWSQAGVPHKGWRCEDIDDVGDDLITCEMCECAEVRYVHTMSNPRWGGGTLRVGCVCAGRMEEDAVGAETREAEFKARQRNPHREECLAYVRATDDLLAGGGLSDREREFVSHVRWLMDKSSRARTKKWRLSEKQRGWFAALCRRAIRKSEKGTPQ
jgi:hypothetical protein